MRIFTNSRTMRGLGRAALLALLVAWAAAGSLAQTEAVAGPVSALVERLIAALDDAQRTALLDQTPGASAPELGHLLTSRLDASYRSGDYRTLAALGHAQLLFATRAHDDTGLLSANGYLGYAYDHMGDSVLGLDYMRTGMAIAERTGDRAQLASLLNMAGTAYGRLGNFAQGVESLRRAQALFRELGDDIGQARILNNLGLVYQASGEYRHAVEQFQACLTLSRKLNAAQGIGYSLNNLASVYLHLGDERLALEYLVQSLALKRTLPNKADVSSTLLNLSVVHQHQNLHAQALQEIEEALKLDREVGNQRRVAYNLSNRGESLHALGRDEEAWRDYEEALAASRQEGDRMFSSLVLTNEAELSLNRGELERALQLGMEAAALARELGVDQELSGALDAIARTQLRLGRKRDAIASFEQTIQTIEKLRGQVVDGAEATARFLEKRVDPYRSLMGLYLSEGRPADALRIAERIKGRVLLDALDRGRVDIAGAMTAEERAKEKKLSDAVASLGRERSGKSADKDVRTRWERAQVNLQDFESEMYAAHPDLRFQRADYPEFTLERAQALLPARGSAAVEFAYGGESLYAFVMVHGESAPVLHVRKLGGPKEIEVLIERLRTQIASRDLGYREAAGSLYRLLLGPLENDLRGANSWIIVPDGPLWRVPFAALIAPSAKHLIEERTFSLAHSLTVLAEERSRTRRSPRAPKTLLALGNPPAGALPELPHAAQEVASLRPLYANSSVYVGASATEDRFKADAAGYRVLHLATHGVLEDANPLYSYLVLGRGASGSEDGLLEAREIMNLDLHADLAVLSACDTANGQVASGEGLVGLSWAFQVAGVPSIVTSQWSVDSASTSALMVGFHQRLQKNRESGKGPLGKAAALREAALDLMKTPEYRHPFYWSAFVLVGAGD